MKTAKKAAFTLVELMVVIGLMALLGTISVTGYFAAVRGMSDRGALDDTRSLIRLAMQTCLIDQTPTAVLFYNRQNQVQTANISSEEVKATSSGFAIAIKMAGRISFVKSDVLVDEFADWNQSYPVKTKDSASKSGVRFYRMTNLDQLAQGIDYCSSLMYDYVQEVHDVFDDEPMIAAGLKVQDFCRVFKKRPAENRAFSGTDYDNGNNYRWGRRIKSGRVNWKIGDAYGVEIATLDLPKGYIFGDSGDAPGSMKNEGVKSLSFSPDDVSGARDYAFSLRNQVTISAWRGDKFKSIGSFSSKSDFEDDTE